MCQPGKLFDISEVRKAFPELIDVRIMYLSLSSAHWISSRRANRKEQGRKTIRNKNVFFDFGLSELQRIAGHARDADKSLT